MYILNYLHFAGCTGGIASQNMKQEISNNIRWEHPAGGKDGVLGNRQHPASGLTITTYGHVRKTLKHRDRLLRNGLGQILGLPCTA